MTLHIFGADNLAKGPLADALFDFVATVKHFSLRDNVVVVLIVPTIVVGASGTLSLFLRFRLLLGASSSPCVPLFVVNRVDVLVGINKGHGQFDQRSIGWYASYSRLKRYGGLLRHLRRRLLQISCW